MTGNYHVRFLGGGEGGDTFPATRRQGRARLRELRLRQSDIEQQLQALAQAFKKTFRSPRPVHLVVHRHGGYLHLRWRASATHGMAQTYLELIPSDGGRRILDGVPPNVRVLLLQFERTRLSLNLASSLTQHELYRLQAYLTKLGALREEENRT